jgi:general secretion pathway protein F
MKEFYYQAIDKEGRKLTGVLSAPNTKEVRDLLRLQGLDLLKIKISTSLFTKKKNKNFLLTFTLNLKQLLEANIPIYESLLTLKEQSKDKQELNLIIAITEKIRQGQTFSHALSLYPHIFDSRYVSMCKSGEMSGSLLNPIKELSLFLEKEQEFRKKITNALLYPLLLAIVCLTVISLLLFFVVPSMETLLEGKQTTWITHLVVNCSKFFRNYGAYLIVLFLSLFSFFMLKKEKIFKSKKAFVFYLKIPVLNVLIIKTKLAIFFRTLATLQKAGVDLIDSLELSKNVVNFPNLEHLVETSIKKITQGSTLAQEFRKSSFIPLFVNRMLAIAEETAGNIFSFEKIAEFYEKDSEKALERLTIFLQPIMLVFMALIIGLVMLALLIPLTDVTIWLGE